MTAGARRASPAAAAEIVNLRRFSLGATFILALLPFLAPARIGPSVAGSAAERHVQPFVCCHAMLVDRRQQGRRRFGFMNTGIGRLMALASPYQSLWKLSAGSLRSYFAVTSS